MPLLGKLLKGGAAYTYLPASVRRFPGPDELAGLMRAAGFDEFVPHVRRRDRRAPHRDGRMSALATIREAPGLDPYLEELEERLERPSARTAGSSPPRRATR